MNGISITKLAVVTGASTGIGYELAKACARDGFDLIIVADEPRIHQVAEELRRLGNRVEAVQTDLAQPSGVDEVVAAVDGRPVSALLANAAIGRGDAFLSQDFGSVRRVVATNITETLYLIHRIGGEMQRRAQGRILITGSIAGYLPGPFNAVYNASKSFIDSFAWALRNELQDSGVTVTCLMPGATQTNFFARAGLLHTKLGQQEKDDAADVAEAGFNAMMAGRGDIVTGWHNKIMSAFANIVPASILAERHRKMAEPSSGDDRREVRR
jgi:short-subunit dehydrogenase